MTLVHKISRHDAQAAVQRYRELTGDEEAYLDRVTEGTQTFYSLAPCDNEGERGPRTWPEIAGAPRFVEKLEAYIEGFQDGKQ